MKNSFESPINATEENSLERRNRRRDEMILILGQLASNNQEMFENPKLFRAIKTDDIDAVENKDLEKLTKRIQETNSSNTKFATDNNSYRLELYDDSDDLHGDYYGNY